MDEKLKFSDVLKQAQETRALRNVIAPEVSKFPKYAETYTDIDKEELIAQMRAAVKTMEFVPPLSEPQKFYMSKVHDPLAWPQVELEWTVKLMSDGSLIVGPWNDVAYAEWVEKNKKMVQISIVPAEPEPNVVVESSESDRMPDGSP